MRPGPSHPGNGYGRPVGRPGPSISVEVTPEPDPAWFADESLAPTMPSLVTPAHAWQEMLDF